MNDPVSVVKARARRMQQRLQQLGSDVKLTHLLEALAAADNFPDWNRFHAHLGRTNAIDPLAAPVIAQDAEIKRDDAQTRLDQWLQDDRHQGATRRPLLLHMPPGSGKSMAVTCIAALATPHSRMLIVDCSGTNVYMLPPDREKDVYTIDIAPYNDHIDIPVVDLRARSEPVVIIRMHVPVRRDYSRNVAAKAFMYAMSALLPDNLENESLFEHIIVDDLHMLGLGNKEMGRECLPRLAKQCHRLVLATQAVDVAMFKYGMPLVVASNDENSLPPNFNMPTLNLDILRRAEKLETVSLLQKGAVAELAAISTMRNMGKKEVQFSSDRTGGILKKILGQAAINYQKCFRWRDLFSRLHHVGIESNFNAHTHAPIADDPARWCDVDPLTRRAKIWLTYCGEDVEQAKQLAAGIFRSSGISEPIVQTLVNSIRHQIRIPMQ